MGDPYRGYRFRILTRQGAHAAGGAYDYLINGRLIAGFVRGIPPEYIWYGVNPEESRGRFEEAYDLIMTAWTKPVFDVYRQYELNREWNVELVATARAAQIDFMTTPYDDEAVESVNALVPAWKIGSGDITFISFIEKVARTGKPILLATGASTQADVDRAVKAVLAVNRQLVLMQCNTNYTGSLENFVHINLNVLKTYALRYPGVLLGLSDHSPGHATVLGAIALGARAVEKHFTDDNQREGPDHGFAMNPRNWREMVERSRELEAALGDGFKRVQANEAQTAVLQQRCLRTTRNLPAGHVLVAGDLEALRPAPENAARPYELPQLLGRRLVRALQAGDALYSSELAVTAPHDAMSAVQAA